METKRALHEAAGRIGHVKKFKGLLRKTAKLRFPTINKFDDILGFEYVAYFEDEYYQFFVTNLAELGLTKPTRIEPLDTLLTFPGYKVSSKEAVDIFNSGIWGGRFSSMELCLPKNRDNFEPYWFMLSDLGIQVIIGANSGKVYSPVNS